MKKEIIATGKDVQEAQANAAQALGVSDQDTVYYEILALPKKGFLGLGAVPARVKAWIELPDPPQRAPRRSAKNDAAQESVLIDVRPAPVSANTPAPKPMKPESEVKLTPKTVAPGEDLSLDFVRRLIEDLGIRASASLVTRDEGGREICIEGEDASMLIGRHGETLDALQYLSNLAATRKNVNGERIRDHVVIDIEGYRAKREQTLRALARRMAAKALRTKRSVMLEPMNAYERRIIHSEVQDIPGVSTNSVGADNNRKVVIYLTDSKPATPAGHADDAPADDE